jgi:hypothetical protein
MKGCGGEGEGEEGRERKTTCWQLGLYEVHTIWGDGWEMMQSSEDKDTDTARREGGGGEEGEGGGVACLSLCPRWPSGFLV